MKVALYGKQFGDEFRPFFLKLLEKLSKNNVLCCFYKPFYEVLSEQLEIDKITHYNTFSKHQEISADINFMISIGGDGTFLETIPFIRNSGIPVIGLNSGRLGFLANISKEEIDEAIDDILANRFTYEHRSLIQVDAAGNLFQDVNYGLNEVTIQKKDSAMITIHAFIDGEYMNSYYTDGLIVSTPTGSTAYSLSVGGPIVAPSSNNFIISPIASHNLTVRPVVISDDKEITLKVDGRSNKFLVTIDNRMQEVDRHAEIKIVKSKISLKMLKLRHNNFYNTLRNKLMWGLDKRN